MGQNHGRPALRLSTKHSKRGSNVSLHPSTSKSFTITVENEIINIKIPEHSVTCG